MSGGDANTEFGAAPLMDAENIRATPQPEQSATSRPTVSLITTVRNGEQHIQDMFASVLSQTFQDFEMICVDDGSTDGTAKIIQQHCNRDRRLRFVSTGGIGRSQALNLAVSHATGSYLANIDADDLAHPQRLELQMRIASSLERTAIGNRYVLGSTAMTFANGGLPPRWAVSQYVDAGGLHDVSRRLLLANPICHSSFFCPLAVIKSVKGYDTRMPSQLDYDLYTRLVSRGVKIFRIQIPLVAKRVHAGQAFQQRRRFAYIHSSYRAQRRAIALLEGGLRHEVLAVLRFGWSCLPETARAVVRRRGWIAWGK